MTTERVILFLRKNDDECVDAMKARTIDVDVPEGWRRVWRGALKPGDRSLNMTLAEDSIVQWESVELPDDRAVRDREPFSSADWYACVIREGVNPPDEACNRCKCSPRKFGFRFCYHCCRVIARTIRKKSRGP